MDRRIRRLGIALVTLFGLLFAQLAYVQVFAADRIRNDPANATRQIIAEYKVQRGAILTRDLVAIADSVPAGAKADYLYTREYPRGPLYAAITGYYSRVYGRSALEQAMNDYLSGDAPELVASNLTDLVLGHPRKGGSVVTTIDSRLQAVAAGGARARSRAPWWRSSRRPATSWRWSPTPPTTRTSSPPAPRTR